MTRPFPGSAGHQAGTHPEQDTLPPRSSTHTHTHTHTDSDWDNLDMTSHLTSTSLGRGRKLEDLEKTQTDMGECANTESSPSQEPICFPHPHYDEITLF